jgi:type IV secretory pathway VirB4 component
MQHDDSAKFLFALVKRARKYNLWITTITQDIEDFISSPYWKPILTNSSIQLLLKQSSASINVLQDVYKLTDQEKYILLNAAIGQWLFFAWTEHVGIQVVASYYEEQVVTTDPNA